jgi:hypothetical protein
MTNSQQVYLPAVPTSMQTFAICSLIISPRACVHTYVDHLSFTSVQGGYVPVPDEVLPYGVNGSTPEYYRRGEYSE